MTNDKYKNYFVKIASLDNVLWLIVLIGISPAILATSIFPFNWFGLFSIPWSNQNFSSQAYSYFFLVLLMIGSIVFLLKRRWYYFIGLIPIALLVFSPINEVTVNKSLLSFPDEMIELANLKKPEKKLDYISKYDTEIIKYVSNSFNEIKVFQESNNLLEELSEKLISTEEELKLKQASLKGQQDKRIEYIKRSRMVYPMRDRRGIRHQEQYLNGEPIFIPAKYPKGKPAYDAYIKNIEMLKDEIKTKTENIVLLNSQILKLNSLGNLEQRKKALKATIKYIQNWFYSVIYSVLAFIILLIYILKNRLIKLPFVILISILLIFANLPIFSLSNIFVVFLFLIVSITLYIFKLAIIQNISIFRDMGSSLKWTLIFKSLIFWVPAAAILFFLFYKSLIFNQWTENIVYRGLNGVGATIYCGGWEKKCKKEDNEFDYREKHPDHSLEKNVIKATTDMFSTSKKTVMKKLETLEDDIKKFGDDVQGGTMAILYDGTDKVSGAPYIARTLPDLSTIFSLPRCSFAFSARYIKCLLVRHVKKIVNISYENIRASTRNELKQKLAKLDAGGNLTAKVAVDTAKGHIHEAFYYAKKQSIRSIMVWFNYLLIYYLITLFLLIFAALNSFLTIFARLIYHPQHGGQKFIMKDLLMSIETPLTSIDKQALLHKNIGKNGNLDLKIDKDKPCYIALDKDISVDGDTNNIEFPQPTRIAFRRILAGRFHMPEVNSSPNLKQGFRATMEYQYAKWEIIPRSMVVFDIKNLMAIIGDVQIRSVFSMHISSKLIGQNYHSVAYGDGELILKINGTSDSASKVSEPSPIIYYEDLVSCDINCELSSSWKNRIRELYFLGVKIQVDDRKKAAIEVTSNRKSSGGVINTLKYALLPI